MTDEVKTSRAARARAILDRIGAPESDYSLDRWVSYPVGPLVLRAIFRPPVDFRPPQDPPLSIPGPPKRSLG